MCSRSSVKKQEGMGMKSSNEEKQPKGKRQIEGHETIKIRAGMKRKATAFLIDELLKSDEHPNQEQQINGSRAKMSRKVKGKEEVVEEHPFYEEKWLKAATDPPSMSGLECELENEELWKRFDELGTEMIITKSGRRMFPVLRLRLVGTRPGFFYLIYMDLVPIEREHRFRYAYNKSQWQKAGKSNCAQFGRLYLHTEGPFSGEQLSQPSTVLSFDKAKLTNNPDTQAHDQLLLNSMHKYQPRIHVVCLPKGHPYLSNPPKEFCSKMNLDRLAILPYKTFIFPNTTFVAVTAYQNQLVTHLKIESNPFAKGFRDQQKMCGADERAKYLLIPPKLSPKPALVTALADANPNPIIPPSILFPTYTFPHSRPSWPTPLHLQYFLSSLYANQQSQINHQGIEQPQQNGQLSKLAPSERNENIKPKLMTESR